MTKPPMLYYPRGITLPFAAVVSRKRNPSVMVPIFLMNRVSSCDGSHAWTEFQPIAFTAEQDGKSLLCQCKRSAKPPFCDGSHKAITQDELDADQGLESVWYKVAEPNVMQAGEVRSVQAGAKTIALTYINERYGSLDNACPHQGGPLSEGSIECDGDECLLRCPWHG